MLRSRVARTACCGEPSVRTCTRCLANKDAPTGRGSTPRFCSAHRVHAALHGISPVWRPGDAAPCASCTRACVRACGQCTACGHTCTANCRHDAHQRHEGRDSGPRQRVGARLAGPRGGRPEPPGRPRGRGPLGAAHPRWRGLGHRFWARTGVRAELRRAAPRARRGAPAPRPRAVRVRMHTLRAMCVVLHTHKRTGPQARGVLATCACNRRAESAQYVPARALAFAQ